MNNSQTNMGLEQQPWLNSAKYCPASKNPAPPSICVSTDIKELVSYLQENGCQGWEIDSFYKTSGLGRTHLEQKFSSASGYIWAVYLNSETPEEDFNANHQSLYAVARDAIGETMQCVIDTKVNTLQVQLLDLSSEQALGCFVGLELASYFYSPTSSRSKNLPDLMIAEEHKQTVRKAVALASSVNTARHLVNLPASHLNPKTYAEFVQTIFQGSTTTSVRVLNEQHLSKESMHLFVAVGKAAEHKSKLVHIKYRPKAAKVGQPIAFVGKGITFDSGGLNIKPSKGMRLMKKDMGGSATVVGVAQYVEQAQLGVACDFYLALAENAIAGNAFRPGDILNSRKGVQVEIDNTDAEGRLVLADAIDYALTHDDKEKPRALVDVATLTGAMRIAVGTELIGAFCTDETLWSKVRDAADRWGDPAWKMPLYQSYANYLQTPFADAVNSAPTSYGGAISAAMFLQKFVDTDVPWLHFDMMSYSDKPKGALLQGGGNGQAVQLLCGLLAEEV